jgi:PAS domain S-box-containing protein
LEGVEAVKPKRGSSSRPPKDLRQRAEEALARKGRDIQQMPEHDVLKLVHDLEVHQVELEMQNDELRLTQAELEKARDRFADLYDFAPLPLLTLSQGGEVREANLAAANLLGLGRKRLIHEKFSRFLPAESRDPFGLYCRQVLRSEARQTGELTLRTATGLSLIMRLEGIAAEDPITHETNCRISLTDVTGSKEAVLLLQRTRELEGANQRLREEVAQRRQVEGRMATLGRLGLLLSAAHEPAVAARALVDTAHEFCGWDACFLLVHDPATDSVTDLVNMDTLDGRHVPVPVPLAGRQPTPLIRRVLQEGPQLILRQSPEDMGSSTTRFGDTSRVSLSLMYVPVRLEGKSIGVLSVQSYQRNAYTSQDLEVLQGLADHGAGALARVQAEAALRQLNEDLKQRTRDLEAANEQLRKEVTHRQVAEEALVRAAEDLKRSNLDLEQFGYVASHDLQEPLRAVAGYVKLLEHRFPEAVDAKTREYIAGAAEGATRIERLITDLLTFSRLSTEGRTREPADLGVPLNTALRNLQFSIRTANAVVNSGPLPTLRVDASQMVQLFQNLIANALKFRSERPLEIQIGARQAQGRWVIWVRDNGIGMEPQYFGRIFQVFQRLHARDKYPGTGIGLAVCKKIVQRHGGDIWVESQLGQGSMFFFSIPA